MLRIVVISNEIDEILYIDIPTCRINYWAKIILNTGSVNMNGKDISSNCDPVSITAGKSTYESMGSDSIDYVILYE